MFMAPDRMVEHLTTVFVRKVGRGQTVMEVLMSLVFLCMKGVFCHAHELL